MYYVEETFPTWRKHLLRGENICYEEETFVTRIRHLLRGENMYYVEETFPTWRKHLLRGENICYEEETFVTRIRHLLCKKTFIMRENIYYARNMYCFLHIIIFSLHVINVFIA